MASDLPDTASHTPISRRSLITGVGLAAGVAVIAPRLARAQTGPMAPPSTVTTPPRDFGPGGAPTTYFSDPDVLSVDPMLQRPVPAQQRHPAPVDRRPLGGGAGVERAGALPRVERHPEQPAAPLARGQRPGERLPACRRTTATATPSTSRAVSSPASTSRAAWSATRTTGRSPCSPTPSRASASTPRTTSSPTRTGATGSPTRRTAGSSTRERPTPPAAPATRVAGSRTASARPPRSARAKRELPTNCYRIDPSGKVELVVTEAQVPDPNGLCFSHDYKKLYVASTGKGPGDTGPGGKGDIHVFDVGSDNKLSNPKLFSDCMVDGVKCGPDGLRCDVDGNLWASSNAGRSVGYSGVLVFTSGRQADRPDSPSGDLRQRLLRRPEAQPPVHGRQPVPVRRVREHPGRRARLDRTRRVIGHPRAPACRSSAAPGSRPHPMPAVHLVPDVRRRRSKSRP